MEGAAGGEGGSCSGTHWKGRVLRWRGGLGGGCGAVRSKGWAFCGLWRGELVGMERLVGEGGEAGAGDGKSGASSDVLSSDTSNEEKSHSSSEEEGNSSPTPGWPAEKSIGDGSCDGGEGEGKAAEAAEKERSKISGKSYFCSLCR